MAAELAVPGPRSVWELEYGIHDAPNLSKDDAPRRQMAIDDAVEQARILIAFAKGSDLPAGPGFDPRPHGPEP